MTPTFPLRRVQRVRHELVRRELQVSDVQPLGPGFVSVSFRGDSLAGFVSLGFDDHLKLFVPGADGEAARRDYTPRHFDAGRRELTIEFALHGQGAASDWARQAAVGQTVAIGGPRGSMVVPVDYDWHLLAGDATALPAIARRLEELPAGTQAIVVAEAASAADERRFATEAALQLQWLRSAEALPAALQTLQLPPGEGYAWAAGEAAVMARVRAVLVEVHGLPKEDMRVSAYWKRGAADYHEDL